MLQVLMCEASLFLLVRVSEAAEGVHDLQERDIKSAQMLSGQMSVHLYSTSQLFSTGSNIALIIIRSL